MSQNWLPHYLNDGFWVKNKCPKRWAQNSGHGSSYRPITISRCFCSKRRSAAPNAVCEGCVYSFSDHISRTPRDSTVNGSAKCGWNFWTRGSSPDWNFEPKFFWEVYISDTHVLNSEARIFDDYFNSPTRANVLSWCESLDFLLEWRIFHKNHICNFFVLDELSWGVCSDFLM